MTNYGETYINNAHGAYNGVFIKDPAAMSDGQAVYLELGKRGGGLAAQLDAHAVEKLITELARRIGKKVELKDDADAMWRDTPDRSLWEAIDQDDKPEYFQLEHSDTGPRLWRLSSRSWATPKYWNTGRNDFGHVVGSDRYTHWRQLRLEI